MVESIADTSVVLLAGGKGTRISSSYPGLPKILIPVEGKTILRRHCEYLDNFGFKKIILSLGYLAEQVIEALDQIDLKTATDYFTESKPLGTGGALKFIADLIEDQKKLFVMNGDTIATIDYYEMLKYHNDLKAEISIVSIYRDENADYGTLQLTKNRRIRAFNEKSNSNSGWINAGIYCINTALLESAPAGVKLSLEYDLFPQWIKEDQKLYAYVFDGEYHDFGTSKKINQYLNRSPQKGKK